MVSLDGAASLRPAAALRAAVWLALLAAACGDGGAPQPDAADTSPTEAPPTPGTGATAPPEPDAAALPPPELPAEEETPKEEAPAGPSPRATIALAFVGDVSFAWRPTPSTPTLSEEDNPLRHVRHLWADADLVMANMEGVLTEGDPRYAKVELNLWAPPIWAPAFAMSGIDAVSTANNHALDGRAAGVFSTREAISRTGVVVIGSGASDEEARRPHRYDTPGGCVSVLPATLGVNLPVKDGAHLALYIFDEHEEIFDEIAKAEAACQFTVVYVHWGPEYLDVPIGFVRRFARRMVDAGVDLIVGHHPHVLQGVQYIGEVPVAYSLGNFVFARATPIARLTGVLRAEITLAPRPRVERLWLHPAAIHAADFTPRPTDAGDRRRVLERLQLTSRPFNTQVDLDGEVVRFAPPPPRRGQR